MLPHWGHETDAEVKCDRKCIQLPGAQESSEMIWKTSIRAKLFRYNPYMNDLLALDQLSGGLITQIKAQWMHAHTFECCSSLFLLVFVSCFFGGLANELISTIDYAKRTTSSLLFLLWVEPHLMSKRKPNSPQHRPFQPVKNALIVPCLLFSVRMPWPGLKGLDLRPWEQLHAHLGIYCECSMLLAQSLSQL